MKKLLLLVLLTSMFGTAHATRSRMNSLGQDTNQGSFYLMDNRNFFRNPANAAKMRNFMVAELATDYINGAALGSDENVEAGYFGEFNSDMAFGVYLGKTNALIDLAAVDATNTWLNSTSANPLNLFLGGGTDMKWGINLGYASTDKEVEGGKQKYNSMGLAAGIETSGGLQVYASYQSAKTEGYTTEATPTFHDGEIKSAPMTVGVIYALNAETTIFGQYNGGKVEFDGGGEDEFTNFILGIGRIYELSPTARFNFDLSYNFGETQESGGAPALKNSTLPLVIGLEADATEWLILRASVRQNFILGEYEYMEGDKVLSSSTGTSESGLELTGTRVALGATLHFGKLKIDGNLGGFGGQQQSNLFDATNFFVNAAATYMF